MIIPCIGPESEAIHNIIVVHTMHNYLIDKHTVFVVLPIYYILLAMHNKNFDLQVHYQQKYEINSELKKMVVDDTGKPKYTCESMWERGNNVYS